MSITEECVNQKVIVNFCWD